jgi:hypothetical protein
MMVSLVVGHAEIAQAEGRSKWQNILFVTAVVTQEHLTEALRRLRRNTSETNVDR